jgi:hypothetical protein
MEPVFMVLGQSAATAAAIAIEKDSTVQEVDYAVLQQRLRKAGQVLDFTVEPAPDAALPLSKVPGIVLDDRDAQLRGFDKTGNAAGGYVGTGYRHDGDASKGSMSARFTPDLPKAGRYQVAVSYTTNPNRATNAPVTVYCAQGEKSFVVNQKLKPAREGIFHVLGTFDFAAGKAGWVEISNAGTDGHVIVDAVQWIPVP